MSGHRLTRSPTRPAAAVFRARAQALRNTKAPRCLIRCSCWPSQKGHTVRQRWIYSRASRPRACGALEPGQERSDDALRKGCRGSRANWSPSPRASTRGRRCRNTGMRPKKARCRFSRPLRRWRATPNTRRARPTRASSGVQREVPSSHTHREGLSWRILPLWYHTGQHCFICKALPLRAAASGSTRTTVDGMALARGCGRCLRRRLPGVQRGRPLPRRTGGRPPRADRAAAWPPPSRYMLARALRTGGRLGLCLTSMR